MSTNKLYFIPKNDLENEVSINLKVAISGLRSQLEKLWNNHLTLTDENKKLRTENKTLKAILNERG